jgi:[ribosomal protein S5]-alanine N-acetyltransferase
MLLHTPRLTLRELAADDFAAVHSYACDPLVTQWMIWGPNSPEQTRSFLDLAIAQQKETPRRNIQLAVTLRDTGQLIGACGLTLSQDGGQADLGYVYHRPYWRQGYATEAGQAMLRFGFADLKLHRIHATCDVGNVGSATVLRKLGMRHEGTLRSHWLVKNRWRDSHLFALLQEEWAAAWPDPSVPCS